LAWLSFDAPPVDYFELIVNFINDSASGAFTTRIDTHYTHNSEAIDCFREFHIIHGLDNEEKIDETS
jgi:hypothetical protein